MHQGSETEPEREPKLWLYRPSSGWWLCYIALGTLLMGVAVGVSFTVVALYILGPLAVVLCVIGAFWAILRQSATSSHNRDQK